MKAMLKAIQNKRQSCMPGEMEEGEAQEGSKDLGALVQSLSDDEKAQLLQMLQGDGDRSIEIAKGGASSEEQGQIDQSMKEENAMNAMQNESDGERFPSAKPKSLSQRLLANAQKHMKGKL